MVEERRRCPRLLERLASAFGCAHAPTGVDQFDALALEKRASSARTNHSVGTSLNSSPKSVQCDSAIAAKSGKASALSLYGQDYQEGDQCLSPNPSDAPTGGPQLQPRLVELLQARGSGFPCAGGCSPRRGPSYSDCPSAPPRASPHSNTAARGRPAGLRTGSASSCNIPRWDGDADPFSESQQQPKTLAGASCTDVYVGDDDGGSAEADGGGGPGAHCPDCSSPCPAALATGPGPEDTDCGRSSRISRGSAGGRSCTSNSSCTSSGYSSKGHGTPGNRLPRGHASGPLCPFPGAGPAPPLVSPGRNGYALQGSGRLPALEGLEAAYGDSDIVRGVSGPITAGGMAQGYGGGGNRPTGPSVAHVTVADGPGEEQGAADSSTGGCGSYSRLRVMYSSVAGVPEGGPPGGSGIGPPGPCACGGPCASGACGGSSLGRETANAAFARIRVASSLPRQQQPPHSHSTGNYHLDSPYRRVAHTHVGGDVRQAGFRTDSAARGPVGQFGWPTAAAATAGGGAHRLSSFTSNWGVMHSHGSVTGRGDSVAGGFRHVALGVSRTASVVTSSGNHAGMQLSMNLPLMSSIMLASRRMGGVGVAGAGGVGVAGAGGVGVAGAGAGGRASGAGGARRRKASFEVTGDVYVGGGLEYGGSGVTSRRGSGAY